VKINFFLNNQPDALIIPILFCYKNLHISGIFPAHHQEFSTVHSALVSLMQVSDDRFQAKSGWNCSILQTGHITLNSTPDQQLENHSTKYHRQQQPYNTLELLMMGTVVPETC